MAVMINMSTGETREVSREEYKNTCKELNMSYMPTPDGWRWVSFMTNGDWLRLIRVLRKATKSLEDVVPTVQKATQSIFDYTECAVKAAAEGDNKAE